MLVTAETKRKKMFLYVLQMSFFHFQRQRKVYLSLNNMFIKKHQNVLVINILRRILCPLFLVMFV